MRFPPGYIEMIKDAAVFIRRWLVAATPSMVPPEFSWSKDIAYTGVWSDATIGFMAKNLSATILLRDLSKQFPDISIMMTQTAWELVEQDGYG